MTSSSIAATARKAICVSPQDTVLMAVDASIPEKAGAVAVVENGLLVGILSERDVMVKVLHQRLDPNTTLVRDVMTTEVMTIRPDTPFEEIMGLMLKKHIRHLPVSADGKTVTEMVSLRNVLQHLVIEMKSSLRHMESYLNADSPGG
ncbi:MAG: CBS domain-containing protein [Deltaproteobacteria bacterium]|nr:CBS domain-containing protein [Deltaproteobacteria bacterium]